MDKITKPDYKHGRFNIATTSFDPNDFFYSDYEEDCEMNNIEPKGEDSDDYRDWMAENTQTNYEEDMYSIKNCKQYNVPVRIEGTLGLWDGRHEIIPQERDSVYSAIIDCIGRSTNDVEVFFDDGHIEVQCHHHDGTNTFYIYAIGSRNRKKRLPYLYNIY